MYAEVLIVFQRTQAYHFKKFDFADAKKANHGSYFWRQKCSISEFLFFWDPFSPWPWWPCPGCGSWTWGGSPPSLTCSTHLQKVKHCLFISFWYIELKKSIFVKQIEDIWNSCENFLRCLEFCRWDIWKDWDQHFNTKILHFSSAKHSIWKTS